MTVSQIFAVNNNGRVFTLMTNEKHWREIEYLGIEFKKVSAHEIAVWAIGGDHQVYVYVYGTTVPIRVCEDAYENQRWRPGEDFSHHLLPTDRPAFSSADGLTERTLPGVHLPTMAWQWEGPWTIHTTFAGQQLQPDGWTYALDFPRHYSAAKSWNSCVRRRRWTRYRRYVALNTWSAVPSIHQDYTQEPFIDLSVGGGEVAGGEADVLMVWGVTALGKVMVRSGVTGLSPEGVLWVHVPTPPQHDVTSISVGRSGRVWAVTWDGKLIIRTGITRDCELGSSWLIVQPPDQCPLTAVGVGVNAVWGCGRDHSVWFRRGLDKSDSSGELSVSGLSWLCLEGQCLLSVSVGPDDQVWGIDSSEYSVVARIGITSEELTGRSWRPLSVPVLTAGSISDDSSSDTSERPLCMDDLAAQLPDTKSISANPNSLETSHDKTLLEIVKQWDPESKNSSRRASRTSLTELNNVLQDDAEDEEFESASDDGQEYLSTEDLHDGVCGSKSNRTQRKQKKHVVERSTNDTTEEPTTTTNLSNFGHLPEEPSPVADNYLSSVPRKSSSEQVLGTAAAQQEAAVKAVEHDNQIEGTRSRHVSSSSDSSGAALQQATVLGLRSGALLPPVSFPALEEHLWLCVSGGGCWISPTHYPEWFSGGGGSCDLSWRENILFQLHEQQRKLQPFRGLYREVVSGGSWTVSVRCRWLSGVHWYPANVSLTTPHFITDTELPHGGCDSDEEEERLAQENFLPPEPALFIEFDSHSKKKFSVVVSSVLIARLHVLPPSRCLLALYCIFQPHEPLLLQFQYEHTAEEWMDHISAAQWRCAQTKLRSLRTVTNTGVGRLTSTITESDSFVMHKDCCSQDTTDSAESESDSVSCPQKVAEERGEWEFIKKNNQLKHRPSPYCVWAITQEGALFVHDSAALTVKYCCREGGDHKLPLTRPRGRQVFKMASGFTEGCSIAITFCVDQKPNRFHFNLQSSSEPNCSVALHFNPRISKKVVVLNSFQCGVWQSEERHKLPGFLPNTCNTLVIVCQKQEYQLIVNGRAWHSFGHRMHADSVSYLLCDGDMVVTSVTYSHPDHTELKELPLSHRTWEGVGGHLVHVAAGAGGVTWAISNDCHAYTYTGGRGGGPYKAVGDLTSQSLIHPESDVAHDYVWENQRWNPVTGFSVRGLLTDRPTWTQHSEPTRPLTREEVRPPSRHWSWTSDWTVDFYTPGGCDHEGWQHATDYTLSFHAHRYVTDMVRRRRWKRRRRITTTGPWVQLGRTPLLHVDVGAGRCEDGSVPVWGVTVSGEVLLRTGVTPLCPEGLDWTMVSTDCPVASICVDMGPCLPPTPDDPSLSDCSEKSFLSSTSSSGRIIKSSRSPWHCQVWCVTRDGRALVRMGVTPTNPVGIQWADVDAPGAPLRVVQVGGGTVWGLDTNNSLYRREKTQPLFPEGTNWSFVSSGVIDISVSGCGEVWAVLSSSAGGTSSSSMSDIKDRKETIGVGAGGVIARRVGVSKFCPHGCDWEFAAGAGWVAVNAKMMLPSL